MRVQRGTVAKSLMILLSTFGLPMVVSVEQFRRGIPNSRLDFALICMNLDFRLET